MSRNASGTYTLPAAVNPVVPGTTITTNWANTTLSDIATALTASLDRDGKGEMNAALKIVAGSAGTPGLSFATDTDTGIYRVAANQLGISSGGAAAAWFTAAQMNLPGRLVQNLNATFDLLANTRAYSTVIGEIAMSTPITVASGNTILGTALYMPVEMDGSTAVGFDFNGDSGGAGASGTLTAYRATVTADGALSHALRGMTVAVDASAATNVITFNGVDVALTLPAGVGTVAGSLFGATVTGTGAAGALNGITIAGDGTTSILDVGLQFIDIAISSAAVYRKLQSGSDTGLFLVQYDSSSVTRFYVDYTGELFVNSVAAHAATFDSTRAGAPATSTGNDANRMFRIVGSTPGTELAQGFFTSTTGTWLQSRSSTNYATNRPLVLNPNGASVVVGTATAASITNSQGIDCWNGSIRAQGGSQAVGAGVGAEMDYTGSRGRFFTYNRGTGAWAGTDLMGLDLQFYVNNVLTASMVSYGLNMANTKVYAVNGLQVVTARQTGWTAATGSATRTTFATTTVTTQQLAERVKALIDDLIAHGLIGA